MHPTRHTVGSVTTHEPEITSKIALTAADRRTLNAPARGWSRQPLHDTYVRGPWGRRKRWDYWSIQAGDLLVSGVVANIDYLSTSDIWWRDLATGSGGGSEVTKYLGKGFDLPSFFGSRPVRVAAKNYSCEFAQDDACNMSIRVEWSEATGETGELDAVITMPSGQESLNVVIPWSDRVFQYTSKHQARPVTGSMRVGDRTWTFADEAWGILDIGRGRWPFSTRWNWGGGSGYSREGARIGIQIGGKWTDGTGFTENGVFVDGRLSKIGRELNWTYDWEDTMKPWRVVDPDGQIDITMIPKYDKHTKLDLKILMRETHQVFGTWTGSVIDDAGCRHDVDGIQGFAEECRARW